MHLVSAKIMLGGDIGQVVWRQADNPLSWPEVGVIQYTHGEESVFDIEVVAEVEGSRGGEKARLVEIYGRDVIEMIYPGRTPMLEMEMPGVTGVPKPKKQKPAKTVAQQPALGRFAAPPKLAPIPAGEPYVEETSPPSELV